MKDRIGVIFLQALLIAGPREGGARGGCVYHSHIVSVEHGRRQLPDFWHYESSRISFLQIGLGLHISFAQDCGAEKT